MIKTVRLYGSLERDYGSHHKCLGDSAYLIINHLMKKHKGFREDIRAGKFYIFDGCRAIPANRIHERFESNELHLMPAVEGSISLGAALVIGAVIAVGAAVLYFAMPEIPNGAASDANPSYQFNGTSNVSEQGLAIPVICGICRYGSIVISNGVYPEELENYDTSVGVPTSGGGGGNNTRQQQR